MSPPPKDYSKSKYANYEEWHQAKLISAKINYERNKKKYNEQQINKYHKDHPDAKRIDKNKPKTVKEKGPGPGRPKGQKNPPPKEGTRYGRPPGIPTKKREGVHYGRPKGKTGKKKIKNCSINIDVLAFPGSLAKAELNLGNVSD